jgi:hypothetical protein
MSQRNVSDKLKSPISKTPTYRAYHQMKFRCANPKASDYPHYGARGISVCDRWMESFQNFVQDMGFRPDGMELDRIDNSKGYYPENCRWVTHKQNCRNFRKNRIIEFNGKRLSLVEWSEETGIPADIIRNRLDASKWPLAKALTAPLNSTRSEGAKKGNSKRFGREAA